MHVVVVGAGVFGGWTARWLLRRGASVTLVEQVAPGHSLSGSGGETRVTRSAHGLDDHYPRWQRHSLTAWLDLDRALFIPTGVVWLASREDGLEADSAATMARLGIPAERLDLDELARRMPALGLDGLSWALWEPEAGVILARRAVAALAQAVVAEGGRMHIGRAEPVEGGVEVDGERITADAVVLAAGAWMPRLMKSEVGLELAIQRQEVVFVATPPGDPRFDAPTHPTWVEYDAATYGLPSIEGRGFKVAPDRPGPIVDPDTLDRRLSDERVADAYAYLRRRFPALADRPVAEGRVCQYEQTPDAHFVIDRHPGHDEVWLVGGGSGHGFKHGPAVGEYVSALVIGDTAAAVALEPPDTRFRVGQRASGGAGLRTSGAAIVATADSKGG